MWSIPLLLGRAFVLTGNQSPRDVTFGGRHFGTDPAQARVTYASSTASFNCTLNASVYADDQVSCTTTGGEPFDEYVFSITVGGQASEPGADMLLGTACVGVGVDPNSSPGECTCAANYSGTVTYNTTSITGGCFADLAFVVSPEVLDRATVGATVTINLHGVLLLPSTCCCLLCATLVCCCVCVSICCLMLSSSLVCLHH